MIGFGDIGFEKKDYSLIELDMGFMLCLYVVFIYEDASVNAFFICAFESMD